MTAKIIALHQGLSDPSTGAPVTHHVISQYTVVTDGSRSQVVLQGYISADAKAAGKRPLSHTALDLTGTPEGDTLQWLYQAILAKTDGEFVGAAPVVETTGT